MDELLAIDLESKNTRWLKSEHDTYRGVRIGMWQYYEDDAQEIPLDLDKLLIYVNNLKAVLDTRENIPDKRQRKELRRAAAKRGR